MVVVVVEDGVVVRKDVDVGAEAPDVAMVEAAEVREDKIVSLPDEAKTIGVIQQMVHNNCGAGTVGSGQTMLPVTT